MSDQQTNDGPHMRRCSVCGRGFRSRAAADQHIDKKHGGRGERVSILRDEDPSEWERQMEREIANG